MIEKLIENWLDSASERTFQPIFCQMLMNEGYTVVHSTRHAPIEFGKDVIAIAPDGSLHAYQLKGNAKSRLSLSQYRDIYPQIRELVNQKINNSSLPNSPHTSYLVTNGNIEEEVLVAIENENAANVRDGYPSRKLCTITRGTLLKWALKLNTALWPAELQDAKLFLEIMTVSGSGIFPVEKFHHLLSDLLLLNDKVENPSHADLNRRAKSAALLTALCLKPFSECNNHWSIITAWSLYSVYLIGSSEKYGCTHILVDQIAISKEVIFNHMRLLLAEVVTRQDDLTEGEALTDFAVYSWRLGLLLAIASIFLTTNEYELVEEDRLPEKIETFLKEYGGRFDIWGEAALPQKMLIIWTLERISGASNVNALEGLLAQTLTIALPNIYYGAEEVIRHQLSETLERFESAIELQNDGGPYTSWFARQLMLHLAFRQEKVVCKGMWRLFSKTLSVLFKPATHWGYCKVRTDQGDTIEILPKEREEWSKLVGEACLGVEDIIPASLANEVWLLSLWVIISPQRALPECINHLYKSYQ